MEKKRIDPAVWLKNWQIAQREARRIIDRARKAAGTKRPPTAPTGGG